MIPLIQLISNNLCLCLIGDGTVFIPLGSNLVPNSVEIHNFALGNDTVNSAHFQYSVFVSDRHRYIIYPPTVGRDRAYVYYCFDSDSVLRARLAATGSHSLDGSASPDTIWHF